MKKLFLLLTCVAFTSFFANAQMSINRVKFGVQASPTLGWVKTNDNKIKGNGNNVGFKLGVTADYFFAENYALTTGLGFSFNQGGKLIHETGGNFLTRSALSDNRLNSGVKPLADGVNIRYHNQYLEIPFGLKLRTQQFGYLRAFAEAPVFTLGFATQSKGDISGSQISGDPFLKENVRPDINRLAFSWGFGAGVYYDISPTTAAVAGLYFQKGIIDMTRKGQKALPTADPAKFTEEGENSKASLGNVTLRLGIVF